MVTPGRISERLSVGPQPSREDLSDLAGLGFRTVINLRRNGEEEQPLSPEAEGEAARDSGLEYLHLPTDLSALDDAQIDRFSQALKELAHPAFVHCHAGTRAVALSLIAFALEHGLTGAEILEHASTIGCPIDKQPARDIVRRIVDRRVASAG